MHLTRSSRRRLRIGRSLSVLSAALAIAFGAASASAAAPTATATLASAGASTFVLTVTNTGNHTFSVFGASPTSGSVTNVKPSPACQGGSFLLCKLTVAPGATARACFDDNQINASDHTLVTLGSGGPTHETIFFATLSPSVANCPVHAATTRCVVPNVTGQKQAAAGHAITKAHCRVGYLRQKHSTNVKKGRVISQSPAPGRHLPANSAVKLILSSGQKR